MKKCPACGRTYTDQRIAFCLEDGAALNEVFTPSSVTKQYDPESQFLKHSLPDVGAAGPPDRQAPSRLRISIITRLVAALWYMIPALGGALSSLLLINVFQALRAAETAGIAAVMGGMKEAAIPVWASLYLAVFAGIVVIIVLVVRMLVPTKTASPPGWFFVLGGLLCLTPAAVFWRAQWMVVEALSPGSSVSAGGIGGAGAEISEWLIMSVLAAPVVFIVLIAVSVIPFSYKSNPKWTSLAAATAVELLLVATIIAVPFLIGEPQRKNDAVNLPKNVKHVEFDYDIDRESSMVLTLTADNKIKQGNNFSGSAEKSENIIAREELPGKLKKFSETATPDKQIVYLKADVNASYENVRQVFDIVRKAEIGKVGLVVIGVKDESDPYQIYAAKLEVKLPEPVAQSDEVLKPNPLTLVASLKADGVLTLNREEAGTISDPRKLANRLTEIFKQRESSGVLREGTNEVEKTVFLSVSDSVKYGDFIKLVETLRSAGAEPVGIQLD